MRLQLTTWRRSAPEKRGGCVTYEMDKAVSAMSFLELLDVLNERLERARRGAGGDRARLSREDLWQLRLPDQRPASAARCTPFP